MAADKASIAEMSAKEFQHSQPQMMQIFESEWKELMVLRSSLLDILSTPFNQETSDVEGVIQQCALWKLLLKP
jgi:hypothetical protein